MRLTPEMKFVVRGYIDIANAWDRHDSETRLTEWSIDRFGRTQTNHLRKVAYRCRVQAIVRARKQRNGERRSE